MGSKALGKWIVSGCNSLIQGRALCQMEACNLLTQGPWTLTQVLPPVVVHHLSEGNII